MNRVIVIGGPTASGKTQLGIRLAQALGTEIISADSRQFYHEMRIGNARPTREEVDAVPHHFIADRSLHDPLSAGRYAAEALPLIAELHRRHRDVVVVGGSGLYIRALCEGLDEFPEPTEGARTRVQGLRENGGLVALQTTLRDLDPDYFARVDQQNARRLERALTVIFSGDGRPYSAYLHQPKPPRPFTVRYLQPEVKDRSLLYERINRRVIAMVEAGLEAEARQLYPLRHLGILQTVGYQEWWPYVEDKIGHDRVVELIQRNSRRYAKRQLTWFKTYQSVSNNASLAGW